MSDNVIKEKSFEFSLNIIEIYRGIISVKKEYVLSKQLLRSGTAVGALISEAEYAQSKSDFINKMSIGIKECNETLYWLRLLRKSNFIDEDQFDLLFKKCNELLRLLSSIIITSKKSINRKIKN